MTWFYFTTPLWHFFINSQKQTESWVNVKAAANCNISIHKQLQEETKSCLTFTVRHLRTRTEYIVGVQAPLLLMKATSMAVCRGCAFTHTLLWKQHPWPYIVGVHSHIFCCEGNICGCTSWVGIHQYSVVRATSVALCGQRAFTHTFMKSNSVFLARCGQTWHHEHV